jgi:hypothetical protein
VIPSRHGLRFLALVCVWATVAQAAPPPHRSQRGSAPVLQVLTRVVSIRVPASAFDPNTGQAEVTISRGLVLQVQSGGGWKLQMRSVRSDFLSPPGQGNTKPVSDLQLRNADGGTIIVPNTTYVEIAKGGNTHGWLELAYDVIFQSTTADAGGFYTVNLEFDFR